MSAVGQALIAEVRRIAAENPDYVYSSDQCVYMHEGQPSCIMGKALFNLGYLPAAEDVEEQIIGHVLQTLGKTLGLEVDTYEVIWLSAVQGVQDGVSLDDFPYGVLFNTSRGCRHRLSWGNAVKYADGELQ